MFRTLILNHTELTLPPGIPFNKSTHHHHHPQSTQPPIPTYFSRCWLSRAPETNKILHTVTMLGLIATHKRWRLFVESSPKSFELYRNTNLCGAPTMRDSRLCSRRSVDDFTPSTLAEPFDNTIPSFNRTASIPRACMSLVALQANSQPGYYKKVLAKVCAFWVCV